jgi:serine/threonine protein kinase
MDRAVVPHVSPATNFRDGLGERRRHIDAGGDTVELLCIRRELTAVPSFEFALRERASRFAGFRHDAFARVRAIDRLNEPAAALAVASTFSRGVRLSQLLLPNSRRPVTIDINAALHLIRQIASAVAALHECGRDIAHGAIAPERVILTANARPLLAEYVLGGALEQLRYSPDRYWKELRIAVPPGGREPVKLDQRADLTQLGMTALALVLGRPLKDEEQPATVESLLASAYGMSPRGELEPLPHGIREWIARAVQLDEHDAFGSAFEARMALERLSPAAAASPSRPAPNTAPVREAPRAIAPAAPTPGRMSALPHRVPAVASGPVGSGARLGETGLDPAFSSVTTAPFVAPSAVPARDGRSSHTNAAASALTTAPALAALPSFEPSEEPLEPATSRAHESTPLHDEEELQEFAEGEKGSRSRVAVAAVIVAAVAAAGVFGWRYFGSAPAAPATTGILNIGSNPPGAQIFVDRQGRGLTPLTLTLRPGSHSVELRGIGEPRTVDVDITAGAETSQFIELLTAAPVASGQLQVRTEPPGALLSVDGVERGKTPLLVDSLAPGEHAVVLTSGSAVVRQTVIVEKGATASLVVPMAAPAGAPVSGWITLRAPVDLEVREQGKVLGTSQSERIMVAAGRHELEIVSDTLGYRATSVVQVQPGKVAPITIEWPKGTAALNAEPWAEVWIDGEKLGDTPIGNLSLPIGPHEIVFRHPELGEQRHAVSVSLRTPARISVDMRKQP